MTELDQLAIKECDMGIFGSSIGNIIVLGFLPQVRMCSEELCVLEGTALRKAEPEKSPLGMSEKCLPVGRMR